MEKFNGAQVEGTGFDRYLFYPNAGTTRTVKLPVYNSDRINYAEGPKMANGRPAWKECVHTGHKWSQTGRVGYVQPGTVEQWGPWPSSTYSTLSSRVSSALTDAVNRLPGLSSAIVAFNNEMAGRLESSTMPLVDLAELWSARGVIQKIIPKFSSFNRDLRKLKTYHQGDSWTDVLKTPSGVDLALRFGLLPMKDTITKIVALHSTVADHVGKLRARNDQLLPYKVTVSGGKRVYEYGGESVSISSRTLGDLSYTLTSRSTITIHARAQLNYNTNDALRLNMYLDALGISSPLTIAWELLPWSFFYDYFISIGEVLGQLDQWYFHGDPLERVVRIEELWYTTSASVELSNWKLNGVNRTAGIQVKPVVPVVMQACSFARRPLSGWHLKTFMSMPELNGLGQQSVNHREVGLDLLIQRVLPTKRKT